MRDEVYSSIVPVLTASGRIKEVLSIDLETIITKDTDFLSNERVIAISASFLSGEMKTELYIARDDSVESETFVLTKLDELVGSIKPSIIIGYNQAGYDIPLLRMKMARLPYSKQLWNLKYYLSVSYVLDMMQVISDYLGRYDGDYGYRKLSSVVIHEAFSHLPLDRKKHLVQKDDRNIGEVIVDLWRSGSPEFEEYCRGDTRDVLTIFREIFGV